MGDEVAPARAWRWAVDYRAWAGTLVVFGVLARIYRWSGRRSLNSDELWIAVNLEHRSYGGLHGALEFDQLAPAGWLWLHKALLSAGRGDALLRFPGLVASCAVVALTAVLARRLLPVPSALAAVALVAGAPVLIYQASQLKPYSFEAALTMLLLILALRALDGGTRPRLLAFWLTGAACAWFATTTIFVVGAVGGLLVLFAVLARRWRLVRDHALAAIPAAASIVTVYLMSPPPAEWLYLWWERTYPGSLAPEHLGVRSGLSWSRAVFEQFGKSALMAEHQRVRWLVLGLMAAGAVALAVRLPRQAALVCAPVVAGYGLALLRLYPMATRVALWLVPLAWILVCCGVDGGLRLARRLISGRAAAQWRWRPVAEAAVAVAVAVALVVGVATNLTRFARAPKNTNADRFTRAVTALELIKEQTRPGDVTLVHNGKSEVAMVDWYGPGVGLRHVWYVVRHGAACAGAAAPVGFAAASRVWLLRIEWGPRGEALGFERAAMSGFARPVGEYWYSGTVVALYEKKPDAVPAPGGYCFVQSTPAS